MTKYHEHHSLPFKLCQSYVYSSNLMLSHPDPTQRLQQDENVDVKLAIITCSSPIHNHK
jgi:hypothetical protein